MAAVELAVGAIALGVWLWKRSQGAAAGASGDSVQRRVANALGTGDPAALEALAAVLLKEGETDAAVSLSAVAEQWRKTAKAQQAGVDRLKADGVPVTGPAPVVVAPVVVPAAVFAAAEKELAKVSAPDDSDRAREAAAAAEAELLRVAKGENRRIIAAFQSAANKAGWKPVLKVDGIYGEASRDSLRYYLNREVPLPRYGKATGKKYVAASASEGGTTEDRYYMAQGVAAAVTGKSKSNYPEATRNLVRQWQANVGLESDGFYGNDTRSSLVAYGVSNPPAAIWGGAAVASAKTATANTRNARG